MMMFCSSHPLTELRIRSEPDETRDGVIYQIQVLYCPHCGKDYVRRLIGPDGHASDEKV